MKRGFKFEDNKVFYNHLKNRGLGEIAYSVTKINDIKDNKIIPSNGGYAVVNSEFGEVCTYANLKDVIRGTVDEGVADITNDHYFDDADVKAVKRYIKQITNYMQGKI